MSVNTPEFPQIQLRRICPDCEGACVIQHPLWDLFWQEHYPSKDGSAPGRNDMIDWFAKKGITYTGDIPPEEITCTTCRGDGWVYEWASVNPEALPQFFTDPVEVEGD
jgi:hypothetical protein